MNRQPTVRHEGRLGNLVPPALAVAAAFLVSLLLYLVTMPPTITWWFGGSDSGDLVVAADSLGIPHPTGYPLFVLLGFLVTRLPFGEVAGRINAMDAVIGALSAASITLLIGKLTDAFTVGRSVRWLAACATAVAVATSRLYWSQAIIAEVYILQAFLIALVLLAWARPGIHPAVRGLAHGLTLANHLTAIVFLAAALIVMMRRRAGSDTCRVAAWFAVGVLAPLSLYALLPLRAAHDPAANWGAPDSLGRLLAHVTGRQYGHLVAWRDVPGSLGALVSLVRLLVADLPPWVLPAAMLGLRRLKQFRPRYAAFTALAASGTLLLTAMYRAPDRAAYLLPVYIVLGVWAGVGIIDAFGVLRSWVIGWPKRPLVLWLAAMGVLALSLIWTARAYLRLDLSGDDSAVVFARSVLDSLPQGATYYTARDDVTFTLWYAQRSLGIRRDVYIVDVRSAAMRNAP